MKKGHKMSEEHKRNISLSHIGKKRPDMIGNKLMLGRHHSFETRMKLRDSTYGSKSIKWKGGKEDYWKREALLRDNFTCKVCGMREPEIMEVDHIKQRAKFPDLRYVIENLMTICPNCHRRKTNREKRESGIGARFKRKLLWIEQMGNAA